MPIISFGMNTPHAVDFFLKAEFVSKDRLDAAAQIRQAGSGPALGLRARRVPAASTRRGHAVVHCPALPFEDPASRREGCTKRAASLPDGVGGPEMADPREQRSLASTVTTAADIGIAAIARDRAEPGPGVGRSDPGHALPTLSSPSQGQGDRPPRDLAARRDALRPIGLRPSRRWSRRLDRNGEPLGRASGGREQPSAAPRERTSLRSEPDACSRSLISAQLLR